MTLFSFAQRAAVALLLLATAFAGGCRRVQNDADAILKTNYGDIGIKLYEDTPRHRESFIRLAKAGYFTNTQFHRVVKEFMIQGGDSTSRDTNMRARWGQGGAGYTVASEILAKYHHKRGALAAARLPDQVNPRRESSGGQFYIVTGKKYRAGELDSLGQQYQQYLDNPQGYMLREYAPGWMQKEKNAPLRALAADTATLMRLQRTQPDSLQRLNERVMAEMAADYAKEKPTWALSPTAKTDYTTLGGSPMLDGSYTVFGEVVFGMEVAEKIGNLPTNPMTQQPLQPVRLLSVELSERLRGGK